MKKSNELVKQVSREVIQEGINLEMDWNFGEVYGKRGIIEEDYAYIGSGRYNGVDGFYFKKGDDQCFDSEEQESITEILNLHGFKVIDFQPWEMEHGGDRSYRAVAISSSILIGVVTIASVLILDSQ